MSYTPVPAFFVDDIIDEIFLNTFWRDNMAAGVPDVFSAKGQLPVGLGVDTMGVLNVGADGKQLIADANEVLGMEWVFVPTLARFTNTSYDGDAIVVGGPTTVNISSWGITNPTPPIRAIIVKVSTKWAAAADGSTLQLTSPAGALHMVARATAAGIFIDCQGIVAVNSAGDFTITVTGANTTATIIEILGYFQ